jgi:DNA-directed RNA polymerase subunit RPC12/RpoP
MPQFLCPTCGARLYSASPLTKCAWCGTPLSSDENEDSERRGGEADDEDDSG